MPWKAFFRALKKEWSDDNVSDVAAAITYYGLLAIFPFLLFLVAVASLVLDAQNAENLIQQMSTVAPGAVTQILGDRIRSIAESNSTGLLTIGVVGAIWTASGGITALMRGLNIVYDVADNRSFWKTRGIALGMTLFAAVFAVVAALAMVAAQPVSHAVGGSLGTVIVWVRWPVAALLVMFAWAVLYKVLPDVEQRFRFLSFGSVVGVIIWLVASWGFSEYVSHFGNYDKTYGTLGGVIILLVWMYLSSLVLLLGAEMNAVLEHASAAGKKQGAKSMADTGKGEARQPEKARPLRPREA